MQGKHHVAQHFLQHVRRAPQKRRCDRASDARELPTVHGGHEAPRQSHAGQGTSAQKPVAADRRQFSGRAIGKFTLDVKDAADGE